MYIVFDIDGTLADCTHRIHYIAKHPKNWEDFNKHAPFDRPNTAIIRTLIALRENGHCIELWTGRNEGKDGVNIEKTIKWLKPYLEKPVVHKKSYFSSSYINLRMRAEKDYRHDTVLKEEWLLAARRQDKYINLVFEDRKRVVDMWRTYGIVCCQVAPGEF